MTLFTLAIGFYLGGGFVTSIVVGQTVDGVPPKWTTKVYMATLWPLILATAEEPDAP